MLSIQLAYLAMIAIVTSCNYLVLIPINDWLTWGSFTYPFTFLVTEVTNCLHGPKQARRVVYVGFILAVLLSAWLATPKIAMASGLAFLIAQLLDITIFSALRKNIWWFAPLLASIIASFIDTGIFWSLAFWGEPVPFVTWAISDFSIKVVFDFLLLVPFRMAIKNAFIPYKSVT